MSNERLDDKIKSTILSTIQNTNNTEAIRPNKLRKIVCKELTNVNWTQFQNVVDSMIDSGILETCQVGEEIQIKLFSSSIIHSKTTNTSDTANRDLSEKTTTAKINIGNERSKQIHIKVPKAIMVYLTRKGHRKQKNIETHTKTQFSFDSSSHLTNIEKEKPTLDLNNDEFTDEQVTLTISKTWIETDGQISEEIANKHLKAAKSMILKMVKSYQENPDHFVPHKAGGTLEEQEIARKKKMERQNLKMKRHGLHCKIQDGKSGNGTSHHEGSQKRKRRKFY